MIQKERKRGGDREKRVLASVPEHASIQQKFSNVNIDWQLGEMVAERGQGLIISTNRVQHPQLCYCRLYKEEEEEEEEGKGRRKDD